MLPGTLTEFPPAQLNVAEFVNAQQNFILLKLLSFGVTLMLSEADEAVTLDAETVPMTGASANALRLNDEGAIKVKSGSKSEMLIHLRRRAELLARFIRINDGSKDSGRFTTT